MLISPEPSLLNSVFCEYVIHPPNSDSVPIASRRTRNWIFNPFDLIYIYIKLKE